MPKVIVLDPVKVSSGPGSAGKRRQPHPLTSSSDSSEDEAPSSCSDYENITSPSSSTASGPIYVRTPGFQNHAYSISRPKIKKKRTILCETQIYSQNTQNTYFAPSDAPKFNLTDARTFHTVPRIKVQRNPVPMRLRALPQSFWQQPNKPAILGNGPLFAPLPPLSTKDDGTDLRPVSPTSDCETVTDRNGNVISKKRGERKITVGNTDLLFKLFENVEKKEKGKHALAVPPRMQNSIRRRPTKVVPISNASILSGEDPYMVSGLSEQLFPQLSLEHPQKYQEHSTLHLVTLNTDDRAVTLPALTVEQNYSQMLSELVMHI